MAGFRLVSRVTVIERPLGLGAEEGEVQGQGVLEGTVTADKGRERALQAEPAAELWVSG